VSVHVRGTKLNTLPELVVVVSGDVEKDAKEFVERTPGAADAGDGFVTTRTVHHVFVATESIWAALVEGSGDFAFEPGDVLYHARTESAQEVRELIEKHHVERVAVLSLPERRRKEVYKSEGWPFIVFLVEARGYYCPLDSSARDDELAPARGKSPNVWFGNGLHRVISMRGGFAGALKREE
jgi:hypothetical protein